MNVGHVWVGSLASGAVTWPILRRGQIWVELQPMDTPSQSNLTHLPPRLQSCVTGRKILVCVWQVVGQVEEKKCLELNLVSVMAEMSRHMDHAIIFWRCLGPLWGERQGQNLNYSSPSKEMAFQTKKIKSSPIHVRSHPLNMSKHVCLQTIM